MAEVFGMAFALELASLFVEAISISVGRRWIMRRSRETGSTFVAAVATIAMFAISGCGTTEKSGAVGETLDAKGLGVTVIEVDPNPPIPKSDVTGLSSPSAGMKLVGVNAEICSDDHGSATGPYSFSLETSDGQTATLKYPAGNYPVALETVRDGCGEGWVVFELPKSSEPAVVRYGFEDTGDAFDQSENVNAKFSWTV